MNTKKIIYAGVCIALGLVLPTLLGGIQDINKFLSPMHIPVLVSGFLCGPFLGAFVGFVTPFLRSIMFAMPPLPVAFPMAFELLTYGMLTGFLFKVLPNKNYFLFVNILISMIIGRLVYSIVVTLMGSAGEGFIVYFITFLSGSIITMLLHFIIIPPIVILLKKLGFVVNE